MNIAITTGPFRAPRFIIGTNSLPPLRLIVTLKNPTNSRKRVRVMVDECISPAIPNIPSGAECAVSPQSPETRICNEVVTVDDENCLQIAVRISPTNIYKVTVLGDVDEDAEELEVSVIGTDINLIFNDPSMFFRHDDFVELDDD